MELLVRLLSKHQEELFRFILAMHPHEEDARDIVQECSVALCRKIDEYDPDQPFLPWAFGFAYLEVFKFRERNQRGTRLLSKDILERLARERAEQVAALDERVEALDHCMQSLPQSDRDLIRQRYVTKASIEDLVEQSGASRRTLFRNLDRVRRLLLECITRRLAHVDVP